MIVEIDDRSPVPPFEQLRHQIATHIRAGRLAAGDRLPPVRQLAADLGLAPNTVARAYRELEASGFVAGHGRRGTVVTSASADPMDPRLLDAARRFLDEVERIGAPAESARDALDQAIAASPSPVGARRRLAPVTTQRG